jgi:hypothetical protein
MDMPVKPNGREGSVAKEVGAFMIVSWDVAMKMGRPWLSRFVTPF